MEERCHVHHARMFVSDPSVLSILGGVTLQLDKSSALIAHESFYKIAELKYL
jgi:hypothetical protein